MIVGLRVYLYNKQVTDTDDDSGEEADIEFHGDEHEEVVQHEVHASLSNV